MAHPEASGTSQDSTNTHAEAATGSRGDGDSPASPRAWFSPSVDDFEITPEAAMYAGRR